MGASHALSFMAIPSSQSWKYLHLMSPIEFAATSANNSVILMTFLVAELLAWAPLPQERGDVPGTQSRSGPAARRYLPSLRWQFTLFPCALVPRWLGALSNETTGSWRSWKYIVNRRGNLWEVLLTPKVKLVLSKDWRLLPLLLLHILWNFNTRWTRMHFNKY